MGGTISRCENRRRSGFFAQSPSSAWAWPEPENYTTPSSSPGPSTNYGVPYPSPVCQPSDAAPSSPSPARQPPYLGGAYAAPYQLSNATPAPTAPKPRQLDRRYSRIADDFHLVDQVTDALAQAGLESSNLIVGIDFTKTNECTAQAGLASSNLILGIDFTKTTEWTGKSSFRGRSLHHTSNTPNLYEQAISIIGRSLSQFDDDNLVPCFGFGDGNGYTQQRIGRTSVAPIIETAMTTVKQSGGQYYVPLIISDRQLSRDWKRSINDLIRETEKRKEEILLATLGHYTEGKSVVPNPGSQEEASAVRLVLDSGASRHAVGDKRILQGYRPLPNPWFVEQPDGSFLLVVGVGTIAQEDRFVIPNVYHVEGLKKNLISVSQLAAQHGICFVNKRCEITLSDGTPVGGAFMEDEGNMYVLSYLQVTETEGRGLRFLLDSGASNHMVGDPRLMQDIQYFASPGYATQGDGSELRILGVGTVLTEHFNVPNVQLIEGLTKNLISVGQLDSDYGTCSSFHGNVCKIMLPDGTVLGEAELEGNGLYVLRSLQLPASTPSQE